MSDYSQPEFYRFNQDSLELVKHVRSQVSQAEAILDLGAGCGVIGIELAQTLRPAHLCLLEVQTEYRPHLEENLQDFLDVSIAQEITIASFSSFRSTRRYDLIVCNPPYYLPGHGQESTDDHRRVARSFILDGWVELLNCIRHHLTEEGKAYIVIKNDETLIRHVRKILESSSLDSKFTVVQGLAFLQLALLGR